MLKKFKFFIRSSRANDITSLYEEAKEICDALASGALRSLDIKDYTYDAKEAVDELGIDEELVHQLVEDYVDQIVKSITQFEIYLETLQESQDNELTLDYVPFRELAHKNLGVARNLRIKDAEKLLYELMKKDDLEYLLTCLEALKVCAIKLSPARAFDTLNLIKVKSAL
ncbi:hypothetical protein [Sulfurimonas sp.]